MWRPPQRIQFEPTLGRIPSVAEASASRLFSPVKVGALELAQRTWVPAMVPWRASDDGYVTDDVVDWYCRFARGRPGAIVIEATGIRDVPSGPLLRIGHDRFLPGLERLTKAVREASGGQTKLLIQIIDFLSIRRRPERNKFFQQFLRVSDAHRDALGAPGMSEADVREKLAMLSDEKLEKILSSREMESLRLGHRERVTDVEFAHIRDLPQILPDLFASAALRAKSAGFDGVELHYAHAYTMASFLSRTNTREDGSGATLEGRARLPLEVISAVREKRVKLIPPHWEPTYFHWIGNLRDWCISRQIWWGHRIPIWYNKKDPSKMICWDGEGAPPEAAQNPDEWTQYTDVLDTWLSSALWPFSTLGWPDKTAALNRF